MTGDAKVDQSDLELLTNYLGGDTTTKLADTSKFNPATGLILEQQQDTEATLDAIADMNTNINTQINTQNEAFAKQARDEEFRRMRDAGMFEGASYSATTPDPYKLDYLYDISGDSIFATEEQEALFGSPYKSRSKGKKQDFVQGGQVEDENDRLLELLGGM